MKNALPANGTALPAKKRHRAKKPDSVAMAAAIRATGPFVLPDVVAPRCGKPLSGREPITGVVRVDFPHHPQAIAIGTEGSCLEPAVCDGDIIVAEPVLPQPGELAVCWPVSGRPVIKYLESSLDNLYPHSPGGDCALVIGFRQLNPPGYLTISAAHVQRIWRVAHVIPAADVRRESIEDAIEEARRA